MTGLSRRQVLGLLGGAAAATAVGLTIPAVARRTETGVLLPSQLRLPEPFRVPLPIPPVLVPGRDPRYGDADYYQIVQRVARQRIIPGYRTEIWGYQGIFPGPTIVSRAGRRTVVRHVNTLPVPTVTHLHGGRVAASSDGFPTDLVLSRSSGMTSMAGMTMDDPRAVVTEGVRDYDYGPDQRACTLWYHDHRMGFTGPSVWRGLAGFHLIRDDQEDVLRLPSGGRDIPLMLTDRSFAADGSFRYPAIDPTGLHTPGVTDSYMGGVLGDVLLVNGAPWPMLDVSAGRYRFRVLNASNARRYELALDPPATPFVQIASDGGLLDRPLPHDSVQIAPAERFDLVIDFSAYRAGQQVTLVNRLGSGGTARIMRFRIGEPVPEDTEIPDRLSPISPIDPASASVTRDFVFGYTGRDWTVNGRLFDPTRPIAAPRLGATEIWRFISDFHHAVHLHLVRFQVLSRNGRVPGPYDAGWKDTVDLRPAEQVAVIARFTGYRGRYVLHCHNLEHEDMAMMATVEVS